MKTLLLLFVVPFFLRAQNTNDTKTSLSKDSLNEKIISGYSKSKKEAWKLLESYRQRVIKGENMSTLAGLYSEDPGSAKNGGVYNNIERGMMVAEFENAAFSLKPGEISEVFETTYGFHFIQLVARRGDVVDVRHILIMPK